MNDDVVRIAQVIGKMNNGGVESVVMNYYRNIDKTKIQFDFFVDEDSTNILRDEIEELGGRVLVIPPYQKLFKYVKELISIFKKNKYKIVHVHTNTLGVFSLFCAFIARVPVRISHSHSTSNKKEWKRNLVKNFLKLFSKVFATDYFCCSKLAGEFQFGKRTFNSGKVIVINNAIDISKFLYDENKRDEVRKKLGLEDSFVIGHVGRFISQKNHEFLIEIFSSLLKMDKKKDYRLLLVGEGELEPRVKSMVRDLGIQDKVLFLGPRNDVDELMQGMDIFLLPSLYEGLGMVLIEAQTASLSCIASSEVPACVNITKMVDFVNLNNVDLWCEKIIKIANSKKIRKCNKDVIIDNGYDIQIESVKLEKLYLDRLNNYNKNI